MTGRAVVNVPLEELGRRRPRTPHDYESGQISQCPRSYSGPAFKRWTLKAIVIDLGHPVDASARMIERNNQFSGERSAVERFGQHTKLVATRGNADRLASKFIESVEIQRENPACELMFVSRSPDDDNVVYLTEVWSSESEWEAARSSPAIAEWAVDMPSLVAEPPQAIRLNPVGGKGFS